MAKAKVAVLISGRGSNLKSLIDAVADDSFPAEIALVISNRPKAAGLKHARKAKIKQTVIDHKKYDSREEFDQALDEKLREFGIDFVCLAGFMRMLTPKFVSDWRGRLLNIHPSLLPAFKGLHVHERMVEAGVKLAGCTVHLVTSDMDAGPIIGQAAVPVLPGDDHETLAARILEQEHKLYPACLRLLIENKARLSGATIQFDPAIKSSGALSNP